MKTIRDLFLEQKCYIVTYDLGNNYYIWIENLSENGCTLTREFSEKMLENNVIVELHSENFDDSIAEWCVDTFGLDTTIIYLEKVMYYAIEDFESGLK